MEDIVKALREADPLLLAAGLVALLVLLGEAPSPSLSTAQAPLPWRALL